MAAAFLNIGARSVVHTELVAAVLALTMVAAYVKQGVAPSIEELHQREALTAADMLLNTVRA